MVSAGWVFLQSACCKWCVYGGGHGFIWQGKRIFYAFWLVLCLILVSVLLFYAFDVFWYSFEHFWGTISGAMFGRGSPEVREPLYRGSWGTRIRSKKCTAGKNHF